MPLPSFSTAWTHSLVGNSALHTSMMLSSGPNHVTNTHFILRRLLPGRWAHTGREVPLGIPVCRSFGPLGHPPRSPHLLRKDCRNLSPPFPTHDQGTSHHTWAIQLLPSVHPSVCLHCQTPHFSIQTCRPLLSTTTTTLL